MEGEGRDRSFFVKPKGDSDENIPLAQSMFKQSGGAAHGFVFSRGQGESDERRAAKMKKKTRKRKGY